MTDHDETIDHSGTIPDDVIKGTLLAVVNILNFIDLADLQAYVDSVSRNNSIYDAVGPILDPTGYRDTLHSGRRDHLRTELEITRKLLEIRVLIDGMGVNR